MEFIRLVNLISRHEQTLEGIESRLAEAIRNRNNLRLLYEHHKRQFEEASNNLETKQKSLEQLVEQVVRAQNDVKTLQLPVHPIRRCPSDILRYIFEWVTKSAYYLNETFRMATRLSHVCYLWREIALQTPVLWSKIVVSLEYPPEQIEAFWARTVQRVKGCPVDILIEDIDDHLWESMNQCRLDLIPHINSLWFLFVTNSGAEYFLDAKLELPPTGVKDFSIGALLEPLETLRINPGRIFTQFPDLTSLNLSYFDLTKFVFDVPFDKVTCLIINQSDDVSIALLVRAFPNVKEVSFYGVSLSVETSGEIAWSNVSSFLASSVQNLPWRDLRLPKIRKLSLPDRITDDGFTYFLSSHPSLQNLEMRHSEGRFPSIVENASQLVSLSVTAESSMIPFTFPKLSTLTFYQTTSKDLSAELFGEIVRKHFLPTKDQAGNSMRTENARTVPSFTVLIPIKKKLTLRWRQYELLRLAVEESSVVEKWNTEYRSYRLRWV